MKTRHFLLTPCLSLLCACGHLAAADFLPTEARYLDSTDGGPGEEVDVIGSAEKRAFVRVLAQPGCGALLGVWALNSKGITEIETGKVLLPSNLKLGVSWVVGAGKAGQCVVEERVIAIGSNFVDVEKRGVCDGQPVAESTIKRWEVGRGRVRETYSTGGHRAFVRLPPK